MARTGYFENEITDYTYQNIKGDVSLYYVFKNRSEFSYTYKMGITDAVYQRTNRFKLNDYVLQQHILRYSSEKFKALTYLTTENTGNSYNIRSLAENMDRNYKNDTQWFKDYTTAYNSAISEGNSIEQAHQIARNQSDNERYVPGSETFKNKAGELEQVNNWDIGAALRVKSYLHHAEAQYQISDNSKCATIQVGADYRNYYLYPDGNYFINPTQPDKYLQYWKVGAFVQATKELFKGKLLVSATLRLDKNEYFSPFFNPRLGLVYSPAENHNIRISYQNGYRFPSLFEAFSNVNSGGVKRVGGLEIMSLGQNIFENSYTTLSVNQFNSAIQRDKNQLGISTDSAINKNRNLLMQSSYSYIKPEYVNSFEIGYKCATANKKISWDIDFYFNVYNNFVSQIEVNKPYNGTIGVDDSTVNYMYDKAKNIRYRMWTNSKSTVMNLGSSFGFKHQFSGSFYYNINATYARLLTTTKKDGLEEAFNTPPILFNASFGNANLFQNFGFQINGKWQDSFYWQSALGNGIINAYSSIDLQVNKRFEKLKTTIKLGASNLLNNYYTQLYAGPSIGGMYYVSIIYNQ